MLEFLIKIPQKFFWLINLIFTLSTDGSAKKFLSGKSNNVKVILFMISNKFFVPDLIRMDIKS